MNRFPTRIRVVLFFAFAPQLVGFSGVLAQRLELQPGDKAQVSMNDPALLPFEGSVTETWDGGFEIEVRGESRPRRVDFADVSSLQRSLRVGTQAANGAWIGGVVGGATGFIGGYCYQFDDGCARNSGDGAQGALVGTVAGSLVGAGIGLMIGRYGPWEAVADVRGPGGSGALDRVSVDLLPYPDGRIGLGVTLSLGGGR
jgi:hypothetical protein